MENTKDSQNSHALSSPTENHFRRALISVSDKTDLAKFLRPHYEKGLQIYSTGGTATYLRAEGFVVKDISEVTEFPEVMNGRVKTLHPKVHMGLLARYELAEDRAVLEKFNTDLFDLVIVNLYPFAKAVKENAPHGELIEKIDVGGPSMLRAAAKNYRHITVLCDPRDYFAKTLPAGLDVRIELAQKVFALTAEYDLLISTNLLKSFAASSPELAAFSKDALQTLPAGLSAGAKGFERVLDLRYGENPQQQAAWYSHSTKGLHTSQVLQGKPLSYNNILDLQATLELVRKFTQPSCVIVKHNNPCGVASGEDLAAAVKKAIAADPVSCFGGIVAVNEKVTMALANQLSEVFFECIVAPAYEPAALQIFAKKKNLRILSIDLADLDFGIEYKSVFGGFVSQVPDLAYGQLESWKSLGLDISSHESVKADMIFGEKVCGALKSNAIAIVKNGQTLGLGMGQVNRVDSVKLAIERWKHFHGQISDPILISDAFFPFSDSIELIASHGIQWVLQPGGSVRDEEVIAAAKRSAVNLVFTGVRHFRH